MSYSEDNGFPNGDWDNQSELYWNEREWGQFLKKNASEQTRFLSLYFALRGQPGHLDLVARRMGWETSDWNAAGNDLPEENAEEISPAQLPPYCVQAHPVFIVTRSLCTHLDQLLRRLAHACPEFSAAQALVLAQEIRNIEHSLIMSVTAMDTADFSLALCLAKQSLSAINRAMAQLLSQAEQLDAPAFLQDFRLVLFDLREVALRVLNDANWELSNPPPEGD